MPSSVDEFADIRPYADREVRDVLAAMLSDDELLTTIATLKLKFWHSLCPWLIKPLVRFALQREFAGVATVNSSARSFSARTVPSAAAMTLVVPFSRVR